MVLLTTSESDSNIQKNYTLDNISSDLDSITGVKEQTFGRDKLDVSLMVEYGNGLKVYSRENNQLSKMHDCVSELLLLLLQSIYRYIPCT